MESALSYTCIHAFHYADEANDHAAHSLSRVVTNTGKVLYQNAASDAVPESPQHCELAPVLQIISEKNANTYLEILDAWNTDFTPAETQCLLCEAELSPLSHMAGSDGRAYFLTRSKLIPAKAFIRKCTSPDCQARHSYHTWRDGTA